MPKIDQRTLKTRHKIETALITLCHEQVDFDQLTVPQLAQAAGISRQTFYRHYLTPQQVITELIERHLTGFLKAFRLQNLTAHSMTLQLMTIWQTRAIVFELIEWSHLQSIFIQKIAHFNQRIADQNHVHLIDETTICQVYAAATYPLLRDYVLNHKWPAAQATDLLLHLTNNMNYIF